MQTSSVSSPPIGVFIRNRPFFGAQITMLPALYYLKNKHHEKPLIIFSRYNLEWFYGQCNWIDRLYESKSLLTDVLSFPRKCHSLVSFQPKSESPIITKLIKRPKTSIGFKRSGVLKSTWDHSIAFDHNEYRALHNLRLASCDRDEIDLGKWLAAPFLSLSRQSTYPIASSPSSRHVAIMPGGGAGSFKKWGIENFLLLCNRIQRAKKEILIFDFILGPDEADELCFLKKNSKPNINIHHSLSLQDLSRVVARSDYVIANDCGPSHIAQCLGKPYIGIYDEPKPEWFRWHSQSRIIVPDRHDNPITSISVDQVERHFMDL